MNLSSLNVDVLLHLIGFVKPVDRFNLVLSGVLKGFENAIEGIDFRKRIEYCEAELGLRRGGTCELEIRSLKLQCPPDESLFKILERLAEQGYLQNNRQLDAKLHCLRISRIIKLICSMKNLVTLDLMEQAVTLEDLARVFQSCPQLINLHVETKECQMSEKAELLKNQLRSGLQKLRRLHLGCSIDSGTWPMIQEMLTWLKECVQLNITNSNNEDRNISSSLVIDGSLSLDPNLAKSLQSSKLTSYVPAVLVEWIISASLNIHTLQIGFPLPNGFYNKIARLKKLKKLEVMVVRASDLKEIVRDCRQVEILKMDVVDLVLRDLAELEPAENMTDITLRWDSDPSIKEVLPVLKRWRHLSRLSLQDYSETFPPFEVVSDFILGMKHVSYLHIVPYYYGSDGSYDETENELEILRDQVNELILPRRPNFKFNISYDLELENEFI